MPYETLAAALSRWRHWLKSTPKLAVSAAVVGAMVVGTAVLEALQPACSWAVEDWNKSTDTRHRLCP